MQDTSPQKPVNILQIVSHDTGEMALYLTPVQLAHFMPNYTKFLRERAVCFSNCHGATPECSAARAALATGQEPHEEGCEVFGLTHPPFNNELANRNHHIARWLKETHYSVHAGVEHVTNDVVKGITPHSIYNEHIITPDNYVDTVIPPLLARIEALAKEGKAFYGQIDLEETHREFRESLEVAAGELPALPVGVPDSAEVRKDWSGFIGELKELDRGYGIIFTALEKNGLIGNTLIIATSDHGIAYPGYKCNLTAGGTQVYMSIAGPGFSEYAGTTCKALISHTDIFATICAAIGTVQSPWTNGEPLQQLVKNEKPKIHEAIFPELTNHVAEDTLRAVRTDEWLFIERFGHSTRPPANIDDGAAKTLLLKNPDYLKVPQYQLYHVSDEHKNLAETHPDKVQEFKTVLRKHMHETHDPLLGGWPVRLPRYKTIAPHDTESTPRWLKGDEANTHTMPEDTIYPFDIE